MGLKRIFEEGGTFFFTVVAQDRDRDIFIENIDTLLDVIDKENQRRHFHTIAYVILPDHIHTIWKLPPLDTDYSIRWANIKRDFSYHLRVKNTIQKGERIWQRHFWETIITSERSLHDHVDYIHNNPVKHGYIDDPFKWPYSTIHDFY